MTIEFFLDGLFLNGLLNENYFINDKYTRRFIIAPLVALPIFMIVYFYYRRNKKKVNEKLKTFSQETLAEEKQGKTKVMIYLIATVILLISSILSSKQYDIK